MTVNTIKPILDDIIVMLSRYEENGSISGPLFLALYADIEEIIETHVITSLTHDLQHKCNS